MISVDLVAKRVTLRELRLFLAVARSGSLLRAADDIGLSQPALSKAIAELERTLGVRLFDRGNRGVAPTPHGEILLRHAAGVFEELRQAVDDMGFLTDASRGNLRVGATPTICAGLLPRAIGTVLGNRPRFQFHVEELDAGKLRGELLDRSLDIGIGAAHVAGEGDALAFERLFDDRLFVVAGVQHPLAARRSVTLGEAARQPWVLPASDGAVAVQLKGEFRQQGVEFPDSAVTTMSMLVRYELLATNAFLSVMYGSVLQFGNSPRLLRVLPIDFSVGIPIGVIRAKNRTLAPSAEILVQALREAVRPMGALNAKRLRRERDSGA